MNATETAKMYALSAIFLMTVIVGVLGYLFFRHGNMLHMYEQLLGYMNCFSGGVFFGTTIIHIQQEGKEMLNEYFYKHNVHTKFPVFESLMALGMFAVASLEQLVIMLAHGDQVCRRDANVVATTYRLQSLYCARHERRKEESGENGFRSRKRIFSSSRLNRGISCRLFNSCCSAPCSSPKEHTHRSSATYRTSRDIVPSMILRRTLSRLHAPPPHPASRGNSERTLCAGGRSCAADVGAVESTQPLCEVETVVGHGMEVVHEGPGGMLRTLVLLVAISFHTIFDGLAIGVQESPDRVWQIFTAVAIHKTLVGFCLTLKLFTLPFEKRTTAFLGYASFALMCPAGLITGLVLLSHLDQDAAKLPSGVLQGISAGTFLYVTFFEILANELKHESMDFVKIIFVMVGFFSMASVSLLEVEHHHGNQTFRGNC